MEKFAVVKTLAVIVALTALSAVGCRACCDDYPSRSYRSESLPPPGAGPQPSLASNPVGLG